MLLKKYQENCMPEKYKYILLFLAFCTLISQQKVIAGSTNEPSLSISGLSVSGEEMTVNFSPFPSIEEFKIFSTTNISGGSLEEDSSGKVSGYDLKAPDPGIKSFYQVGAVPLDSNTVLGAIVLNRLAYGPTPDILGEVLSAPETFISNQLNPENLTEEIDDEIVGNDKIKGKPA